MHGQNLSQSHVYRNVNSQILHHRSPLVTLIYVHYYTHTHRHTLPKTISCIFSVYRNDQWT